MGGGGGGGGVDEGYITPSPPSPKLLTLSCHGFLKIYLSI